MNRPQVTPYGCAQHGAEPLLECPRCRREGRGWLRLAVARHTAQKAAERPEGAA